MSIVRVERREANYFVVSKLAFDDPRLPLKGKGLYGMLMTKPANWTVRVDDLVKSCADGRESVQTALRSLKLAGYAKLVTLKDNGKIVGKEWVIFEDPILQNLSSSRQSGNRPIGEAPTERFPDNRENRQSGNPTIGKPPYIVSNEYSVSNDTIVSNEYSTVQYTKLKNQKKGGAAPLVEQLPPTPQVPAAPPPPAKGAELTTFCESEVFNAGPEWFRAKALESGVDESVDTGHYFNRMKTWRADRADLPKSGDWLKVGLNWIKQDGAKAKQIKTNINNASNNTSNNGNSASKNGNGSRPRSSAADIAAGVGGILERLGRKGRL